PRLRQPGGRAGRARGTPPRSPRRLGPGDRGDLDPQDPRAASERLHPRGQDRPDLRGIPEGLTTMRGSRVAAALVALALAGLCVRLGVWQLGRREEKRALNRRLRASLVAPVETLSPSTPPDSLVGRRVRTAGVYDSLRHVVLRGRANGGAPGVELLTPLRREGTTPAMLVGPRWASPPAPSPPH